jgi:Plasmid encoded RepA protein
MAGDDGFRLPVKPLTLVQRRLIEAVDSDEQDDPVLSFMHAVLCQTYLPYRDPGDEVRLWRRRQGSALLEVQAGRLADSEKKDLVDVGLPWGTKPRLILAHLNAEALRQGSPDIEVEASLSAFVKRIRGFNGGREIRAFKDQLNRLSASLVRLAVFRTGYARQVETKVIKSFDLWLHKDERQRVLWPSTIQLSRDYYESLQDHAVPLPEGALGALAHNAMALDVFCWLAHRLRRIKKGKPVFIPWAALQDQFGWHYSRVRKFRVLRPTVE